MKKFTDYIMEVEDIGYIPPILYHGAREIDKDSILERGLVPDYRGSNFLETIGGYIYLTHSVHQAESWGNAVHETDMEELGEVPAEDQYGVVFSMESGKLDRNLLFPDYVAGNGNFKYKGEIPATILRFVHKFRWGPTIR